jgi:hypothetical protein
MATRTAKPLRQLSRLRQLVHCEIEGSFRYLSQLLLNRIAFSNQPILRCFAALHQRLRGGGAAAALPFQQLNNDYPELLAAV